MVDGLAGGAPSVRHDALEKVRGSAARARSASYGTLRERQKKPSFRRSAALTRVLFCCLQAHVHRGPGDWTV
jgi:hypothetical protein